MRRRDNSRLVLICVSVALAIVCFIAGILIGHFAIRERDAVASDCSSTSSSSENATIGQLMIDECKAENMEESLRQLSRRPHLAGTPADREDAEMLVDLWTGYGLDSVKLLSYDVLLSYPDPDNPNKVMITENGEVNFTSALEEEVLRPEDGGPDVVPPFNAYSAQGEPEGSLVYVNYGRAEDFVWLAKNRPDIDVNGSIVIIRYGNIFRGTKVRNAQAAGAIGVILYSDPADYAVEGESSVYPDEWWLPRSGVQRGTVFDNDASGDPLTPGYPSKPYMYRVKESDSDLPKIPSHPIGYGDAMQLLSELGGDEVQATWAGDLNITYRYGPGFVNPDRKVKMSIHSTLETRTIYDVIGVINGAVEPDRYVLVGNHRDAWVYGAVDPSSGTAVLMESARVYSEMLKRGWRPRRSVMFCSWGAEEYGLLGSTEFVEEHQKILRERAVAYINTDSSVVGNYTFAARTTPLIRQALYDAAKRVPDGETGERSVFDVWLERFPLAPGVPFVTPVGAGTDHVAFIYRIGVPSSDLLYVFDYPRYRLSSHPVYHSVYENFYYVKTFLDYGFTRHQAVSRVISEFARDLADSVILPFGCVDYANDLTRNVANLKTQFGDLMAEQNITFDFIESAVNNFSTAAQDFESRLADVDVTDENAVRRVNDQMMFLERAFLDPVGLPGRQWLRHVVSAPSSFDTYSGDAFPGVVDAMYLIEDAVDQEARWEVVKQQMAILTFTIQSAAGTLSDVTEL